MFDCHCEALIHWCCGNLIFSFKRDCFVITKRACSGRKLDLALLRCAMTNVVCIRFQRYSVIAKEEYYDDCGNLILSNIILKKEPFYVIMNYN